FTNQDKSKKKPNQDKNLEYSTLLEKNNSNIKFNNLLLINSQDVDIELEFDKNSDKFNKNVKPIIYIHSKCIERFSYLNIYLKRFSDIGISKSLFINTYNYILNDMNKLQLAYI